jgi:hypothetical protein
MPLSRRLAALLAALMLALVPAACGGDDENEFPSNEGEQTSQGGDSEPRDPDPGPEATPTGTQPGLTQETTP